MSAAIDDGQHIAVLGGVDEPMAADVRDVVQLPLVVREALRLPATGLPSAARKTADVSARRGGRPPVITSQVDEL